MTSTGHTTDRSDPRDSPDVGHVPPGWSRSRVLAVGLVVVVGAAGGLVRTEAGMSPRIADTVRYEIERTTGASEDVDVTLGGGVLTLQVLRGSLSTVTVRLGPTTCDGVRLDDLTLVGTDVSTSSPYVHDLATRAVVTTESIQAALDEVRGPGLDVRIEDSQLVVSPRSGDGGEHHVTVSVLDGRLVDLRVTDEAAAGPQVVDQVDELSFPAGCPVPFGWFDDVEVGPDGLVLTGRTQAAALYEREAF